MTLVRSHDSAVNDTDVN